MTENNATKRMTIEDDSCDRFRGIMETIEICDSEGKLLGHFTPFVSEEERAAYEKALAKVDRAELKRRKEQERGSGRTFEEVFERLQSLEHRG